jgi:hypothetical protein
LILNHCLLCHRKEVSSQFCWLLTSMSISGRVQSIPSVPSCMHIGRVGATHHYTIIGSIYSASRYHNRQLSLFLSTQRSPNYQRKYKSSKKMHHPLHYRVKAGQMGHVLWHTCWPRHDTFSPSIRDEESRCVFPQALYIAYSES